MTTSMFLQAVRLIDQANAGDPEWETWQQHRWPKTYLYGLRMTEWLVKLMSNVPETAFLAARAQHICRWLVPRSLYPRGRLGYLQWRTFLYRFHAQKTAHLLYQVGYGDAAVSEVRRILMKRGLRRDPLVQSVEDAACLVFLQYQFAPFAENYQEDKVVDIVRKTWGKMSPKAQSAARKLPLGERETKWIMKAVMPHPRT